MIRRPATSPLLPYATLFRSEAAAVASRVRQRFAPVCEAVLDAGFQIARNVAHELAPELMRDIARDLKARDRKSTRLNSSHSQISHAVFCLKKTTPVASSQRS